MGLGRSSDDGTVAVVPPRETVLINRGESNVEERY